MSNKANISGRTRTLVTLGILSAIAYGIMVVLRIPFVSAAPFLKYDPKDIVIIIGGFIFGPFASFMMSLVVSFLEMITVSESGPIGMVMNVLSSCMFACTAAFIYKRGQSLKSAVIGLIAGIVLMTGFMLLWNYFVVPIYQGTPRDVVGKMLLPVFLPFNLVKGGINATITMLIYKPLVSALRKAHLIPESSAPIQGGEQVGTKGGFRLGVTLVSLLLLATLILFALVLSGII